MLTNKQRADGWIEHDGGPQPVSGFCQFMWHDGQITWNHADNFKTCWNWRRRWFRAERPQKIIAYRPERTDNADPS